MAQLTDAAERQEFLTGPGLMATGLAPEIRGSYRPFDFVTYFST